MGHDTLPEAIKGTCEFMCPERERNMRETEGLLNHFEVLKGTEYQRRPRADPYKIIKSYARSAAGQETPRASDLRPPHVLKDTVLYLLYRVVPTTHFHYTMVYDFVFDRLRAVRQDMVIQNLEMKYCIELLEIMVRFHAYSGYRMCDDRIGKFDTKINDTHFFECLKRLLVMYDECEKSDCQEDVSAISFENRPEMEAFYLVANLGCPEPLVRVYQLHTRWRTLNVNLALEASTAFSSGNYVRVCRLLLQLPVLIGGVMSRHLPLLRRNALLAMSTAFSNNSKHYPVAKLQSLLLYNSPQEVIEDCQNYGVTVENEGIRFKKGEFNILANKTPDHRLKFLDDSLNGLSLPDVLSGRLPAAPLSNDPEDSLNQQFRMFNING